MDNDEYVERLGKITGGLEKLADDLYKASKAGASGAARLDVLQRARTKLKEYDEFLPLLTEKRRAATVKRCGDEIDEIRSSLNGLEQKA